MDSFAIISIAIFVIIALLVWLAVYLTRLNKKNKKGKIISDFANEQQAKIDVFDFNNNFIIGANKSSKILFFLKNIEDVETKDVIKLNDYIECKQIVNARSGANNILIYDNISLELKPKSKNSESKIIELYNSKLESLEITNEAKIVENWEKIINSII